MPTYTVLRDLSASVTAGPFETPSPGAGIRFEPAGPREARWTGRSSPSASCRRWRATRR